MGDRATVLVVDDDPLAAALVRAALRGEPCEVVQVATLAAARASVAGAVPALLVIDVGLAPDGWAFVGELRASDATRALPVVVSTSAVRPGTPEARGLRVRWLTKPFHLRHARQVLTALLRDGQPAALASGAPQSADRDGG